MTFIEKIFKVFKKDKKSNVFLDEAMQNIARSLSHEMKTPLSAIKMGVSSIKDYLPALLQAHQLALEHHLPVEEIQPRHIDMLKKILDHIETELNFSSTYINMLVMNLKPVDVNGLVLQPCSIISCLEKAFERYPYRSPLQKQLASCNFPHEADFLFRGDERLMIHLIMNLIRNSLYHIEDTGKGMIEIWITQTDKHHILHFKDTAKGISEPQRQIIFDRFCTSNMQNIGLGLSFCQQVMHVFGGSMNCHSVEGNFTEFTLSIPKLETFCVMSIEDKNHG